MAYTRPMVMVFQEYADTSTTTPSASLPPCIIGPCYHIVDAVEDEGNALYGQYTEAGIESGFFPNNAPGALIDEKSVSFRLKNARVRLYSDLSASVLSTGNCLLFDGDSYPKGILVGDVVKLTDKTDPDAPAAIETEYRVTTVDDISKALFLNRTLPAGKTLTVEIQRIIEDITLPAGSEGILLDVTSERFTMIGVMTPIEGLEDAPVPDQRGRAVCRLQGSSTGFVGCPYTLLHRRNRRPARQARSREPSGFRREHCHGQRRYRHQVHRRRL